MDSYNRVRFLEEPADRDRERVSPIAPVPMKVSSLNRQQPLGRHRRNR